jgi:hypothetical protein
MADSLLLKRVASSSSDHALLGAVFAGTAESFREKSSHTQQLLLRCFYLNSNPTLEECTFINGEALGRDVA